MLTEQKLLLIPEWIELKTGNRIQRQKYIYDCFRSVEELGIMPLWTPPHLIWADWSFEQYCKFINHMHHES